MLPPYIQVSRSDTVEPLLKAIPYLILSTHLGPNSGLSSLTHYECDTLILALLLVHNLY